MNVYFHRDFDGICSAAVLSAYLKVADLGNATLKFSSVDYDLKASWGGRALEKPCAIVDFLYHPDAEWWFDHHATTFVRRDWELNYRPDTKHQWRAEYKSCPRLIVDSIPKGSIHDQMYDRFSEALAWCDVIDGAHYQSAEQLIEMKEPALKVNATLSQDTTETYLKFLIEGVEHCSLAQIADSDEVKTRYKKAKLWQEAAIEHIKGRAIVEKGVAFIDTIDQPHLFHRYAVYHLWPDARFQIALYRQRKLYKITVSMNPWRKSEGPDLGAICEGYGGGGHQEVAGVLLRSKDSARRVSQEISRILKNEIPFHQQLILSSRGVDGRTLGEESDPR